MDAALAALNAAYYELKAAFLNGGIELPSEFQFEPVVRIARELFTSCPVSVDLANLVITACVQMTCALNEITLEVNAIGANGFVARDNSATFARIKTYVQALERVNESGRSDLWSPTSIGTATLPSSSSSTSVYTQYQPSPMCTSVPVYNSSETPNNGYFNSSLPPSPRFSSGNCTLGLLTVEQVCQLFKSPPPGINLPMYADRILAEYVDGSSLQRLNNESLIEIGVASSLHRRKILDMVQEFAVSGVPVVVQPPVSQIAVSNTLMQPPMGVQQGHMVPPPSPQGGFPLNSHSEYGEQFVPPRQIVPASAPMHPSMVNGTQPQAIAMAIPVSVPTVVGVRKEGHLTKNGTVFDSRYYVIVRADNVVECYNPEGALKEEFYMKSYQVRISATNKRHIYLIQGDAIKYSFEVDKPQELAEWTKAFAKGSIDGVDPCSDSIKPPTILKEGFLKKQGMSPGDWDTRWFVLTEDKTVSYYESKLQMEHEIAPKGRFFLSGYSVRPDDKNPLIIVLTPYDTKKKIMHLVATDPAIAAAWIHVFSGGTVPAPQMNYSRPQLFSSTPLPYQPAAQGYPLAGIPLPPFLKEGFLKKRGATPSSWDTRWFSVSHDLVVSYYLSKEEREANVKPKGRFLLQNFTVQSHVLDTQISMTLTPIDPSRSTIYLIAEYDAEWITVFSKRSTLWACRSCTFDNSDAASKCEACGKARPPATVASASR